MDRVRPNLCFFFGVLSLFFCAFLTPSTAFADSFSLTIDHCTGGCGSAPFGTITLTQGGNGSTVHFVISLNDGHKFVKTGQPGSTIAFNIIGNPTISLQNATLANWSLDSASAGSLKFDGFGNFEYSINCCNNQNGGSHAQAGPVSFDIVNTGGNLTPASFQELSSGGSPSVIFAVDLLSGINGNTGPVGSGSCTDCNQINAVPEPGSLLLVGSGFSAFALWSRKRSKLQK